jgi:hypothetical protein
VASGSEEPQPVPKTVNVRPEGNSQRGKSSETECYQ